MLCGSIVLLFIMVNFLNCAVFLFCFLLFFFSIFLFFFFFSSRRRHTRWNCDWSSDVCSSDLHRERNLDVLLGETERRISHHGVIRADVVAVAIEVLELEKGEHSVAAFRYGVRSEERRVGKECRSRWSAYHLKKKRKMIKKCMR